MIGRFVRSRAIVALAGALWLSGCEASVTSPDAEFSFRIERKNGMTDEDAVPRSTDNGIVVTGHTWGSECGTTGAFIQRVDDDQLALVVTHYGSTLPCIAVAVPLEYVATIGGLAEGRSHLQVLHTSDNATSARTVFHDFVEVD